MKTKERNVTQEKLLNFLYGTFWGRIFLKFLVSPAVSQAGGFLLNTRISACAVGPFIRKHGIRMDDYKKERYASFNAFFCRSIRQGRRPADADAEAMISPCDGKLRCYEIRENGSFAVKRTVYTLERLLQSRRLARRYRGGLLLIFRLSVDDYHHFCYVADGQKSEDVRIPGIFHAVHPIAADSTPVFSENTRQYALLKTREWKTVLMMEIGAMLVGRIVSSHEAASVRRGEEKGYFEFGGSTVILCFEKGVLRMDDAIWADSREGIETAVRMGECIGTKIKKEGMERT